MRIDRIKLITEMARSNTKVYELAAKAGLCRATVIAVKGGKSCNKDTAQKLSAALGIPLAELLQQ